MTHPGSPARHQRFDLIVCADTHFARLAADDADPHHPPWLEQAHGDPTT